MVLLLARSSAAIQCNECLISNWSCSYSDMEDRPGYKLYQCSPPPGTIENCSTVETDLKYEYCSAFILREIVSPIPASQVHTLHAHHVSRPHDELKNYGSFVGEECVRYYQTEEQFTDSIKICNCNASRCNNEFKAVIGPLSSGSSSPAVQLMNASSTVSPSSVIITSALIVTPSTIPSNAVVAIAVVFPIFVLAVIIVLIVMVSVCCALRVKHKRNLQLQYSGDVDSLSKDGLMVGFMEIADGKNAMFSRGEEVRVGSLAISIQGMVGRGRFGTVWVGLTGKKEPIAVKVFGHRDKQSWENEYKLYQLPSTYHPNVLHYIASSCEESGLTSRYYMVCDYCPMGTLSRYLEAHFVRLPVGVNILRCISSALAHLHAECYRDEKGELVEKSPIAHRDIKSSNILLQNETGDCVLSDLGLALELNPNMKQLDLANTGQVGTYRYMSPEALDAHVNLSSMESFKQIDVYALSLVMWEVLSRCYTEGVTPQDYQMPYQDRVGDRPTLDAMKEAVVFEQRRPAIPQTWKSNKNFSILADTIESCWDSDPVARLTVDCVLMRVENVQEKLPPQSTVRKTNTSLDSSTKGSTSSSSTGSPPPPGNLLALTIGKEVS